MKYEKFNEIEMNSISERAFNKCSEAVVGEINNRTILGALKGIPENISNDIIAIARDLNEKYGIPFNFLEPHSAILELFQKTSQVNERTKTVVEDGIQYYTFKPKNIYHTISELKEGTLQFLTSEISRLESDYYHLEGNVNPDHVYDACEEIVYKMNYLDLQEEYADQLKKLKSLTDKYIAVYC